MPVTRKFLILWAALMVLAVLGMLTAIFIGAILNPILTGLSADADLSRSDGRYYAVDVGKGKREITAKQYYDYQYYERLSMWIGIPSGTLFMLLIVIAVLYQRSQQTPGGGTGDT